MVLDLKTTWNLLNFNTSQFIAVMSNEKMPQGMQNIKVLP